MQTSNEITGPLSREALAQIVADATSGLTLGRAEFAAETLVVFEKSGSTVQVVRVTPLSTDGSIDKDVCLDAAEDRLNAVGSTNMELADDDNFVWMTERISVRNVHVATQTHGTGRVSGVTIFALRLPDIVWAHAFPQVCGRLVGIYELDRDRLPHPTDIMIVCCEHNIAHHTAPIEAGWRSRVMKMMRQRQAGEDFFLRIEIGPSTTTGLLRGTGFVVKMVDGSRKKKPVTAWTALFVDRQELLEIENKEDDFVDEVPDLDSDGPAIERIGSTFLRIDP